ncbi:acyltransferase family protein [Microvirga arsenatis]|uniref:Acyltransferase n=1 Tax=Microvirga arsenatis TaxID=2692265 RepID=A0ABW9YSF5_9HYPH|nr:acyltransferase [Microvirga arsenatis]NBJ09941.1 acyltransferase [Microvirga arsenatis]NBJ23009.1 acyltransferase [Microvirga arsenatis]
MRVPAFPNRAPSVSDALSQEANNFAIIRLALALAVVVSHAFSVTTGAVADEPLFASTGFTLGEHAVNGFFAISGFLVTMSFDRRGWRDYAIARTLRIAPGLVVAVLAVSLLLGAAMTRLPLGEYLESPALRRFIQSTLLSFKSNNALPGVFADNPFKFPMGTVWTLKYEVMCYTGVFALGLVGLLRSRMAAIALLLGLALGLAGLDFFRPDAPKGVETALRLPLIFALGGALYVWRDRARLSGLLVAALALATWLGAGTFLYKTLLFTGSAYGILWLALSPALTRFAYEPRADLSYGTYLYGWPIQQSLHALWPGASAWVLLAPSLAITLLVAALSWILVEKPALGLKARALGRRTLKTVEPAAP